MQIFAEKQTNRNGWYREYSPRNGVEHWDMHFFNHKLHREDGPAIIRSNGYCEWWINDWIVDVESQEEFEKSHQYRMWKMRAFI